VETPGVYDVIRFDGRPALVPDDEIRNIRRFVQALAATRHEPPPVAFHQGERVRITSGPFQGVEGVVVQARNRRRVIVGLAAIGAGFELDVPARSVRPIG
jgi:transcription antitermination factor NusG